MAGRVPAGGVVSIFGVMLAMIYGHLILSAMGRDGMVPAVSAVHPRTKTWCATP